MERGRRGVINLDTHILVHLIGGTLRPAEAEVLGSDELCISSMVVWEIMMLRNKGRLGVDLDDETLNPILEELTVHAIDVEVVRCSHDLDFRSDPADHFIAATSIVHDAPLLTRDRVIRASAVVPLAA